MQKYLKPSYEADCVSALAADNSNFEAGMNGLSNTMLQNLADGDGPVIKTYRFNQDFYRSAFEDYVQNKTLPRFT